jgi:hypothetical protein
MTLILHPLNIKSWNVIGLHRKGLAMYATHMSELLHTRLDPGRSHI